MAKPPSPSPPLAQRSSEACPPRSRGIPAQESRPYHQRYVPYVPHISYIFHSMVVWLIFSCCGRAGEEGQDRRESRSAPAASVTVWKGMYFSKFSLHSCGLCHPRKWNFVSQALQSPLLRSGSCRPIRLLFCRRPRGTSSSCTSSSRSLFQ